MAASVAKTLERIKGSVEAGAYYEAQQMYKTSYHRSKARGKLEDACLILQEGAVTQLSHGQVTCGVELGLLLVEAYTTADTAATEAPVNAVLAVVGAFPPPDKLQQGAAAGAGGAGGGASGSGAQGVTAYSPQVDECARLVAAAIKWAHKSGSADQPRRLHSAFGRYLWSSFGTVGFSRALTHFVRGDDATTFAEAVFACSSQGPASEQDLWLLRAVLQVLSAARPQSRIHQMSQARQLHDTFVALAGGDGCLASPTGHFTVLLIQALEAIPRPRAHDLFVLLRERYESGVLRRDGSLPGLLEGVEATYFNVRKQSADPFGGLLGGLLKSLTEAQ